MSARKGSFSKRELYFAPPLSKGVNFNSKFAPFDNRRCQFSEKVPSFCPRTKCSKSKDKGFSVSTKWGVIFDTLKYNIIGTDTLRPLEGCT